MRSELQREADGIDCDLCRLEVRLLNLADRIKVARPQLTAASFQVSDARTLVRSLMCAEDRARTPY